MIQWVLHWQNLVLLGFSSAIIYPDQLLLWIGQQTGRTFALWFLFIVEIVAIPLMAIATKLLMTFYPAIDWWDMLAYIGAVALLRFLYWIGEGVFRWLFDI